MSSPLTSKISLSWNSSMGRAADASGVAECPCAQVGGVVQVVAQVRDVRD
jgi:hypothetical protein